MGKEPIACDRLERGADVTVRISPPLRTYVVSILFWVRSAVRQQDWGGICVLPFGGGIGEGGGYPVFLFSLTS